MNTSPYGVVYTICRYSHNMQFSEVMKQLQLYRVHNAFNASWDFLEHAKYCLNGVKKPCIDINNINTPSRNILNSIHYDNKFLCNKY